MRTRTGLATLLAICLGACSAVLPQTARSIDVRVENRSQQEITFERRATNNVSGGLVAPCSALTQDDVLVAVGDTLLVDGEVIAQLNRLPAEDADTMLIVVHEDGTTDVEAVNGPDGDMADPCP